MTHRAVLCLFCAFGVFQKGVTVLVRTEQIVLACVGQEVCLNCQLTQSKDVHQVTWQKLLPEGEDNLATSNRYFGQRVNAGFEGKVEFIASGLQNSSIVIRNLMTQDEGCYQCLFNAYPDGALAATTCLKLYELHGPDLNVRGSNSTEGAAVSCSATGQPPPTLTLNVLNPDLNFSNYSSVSVANANGTVTVTKTAKLSGRRDSAAQVVCAVQVLSSPPIEVSTTIPAVKHSNADALDEKLISPEGDINSSLVTVVVTVTVVAFLLVAAIVSAVVFMYKHKNRTSHKDAEVIKTPAKTVKHNHEITTPLMQRENEQVRQRTSTVKKQKKNQLKGSAGIVKNLFLPKPTI